MSGADETPEETVVVPRVLDRPHVVMVVDGYGFIHMQVGNHDDEGKVPIVEDFVIVPALAETIGDSLFKAAQSAKPLYEKWVAEQGDTEQQG
jgi:hypothetical protein